MQTYSNEEQGIITAQYLSIETGEDWQLMDMSSKDSYCYGSDYVLIRQINGRKTRGKVFKNVWPQVPEYQNFWAYTDGRGDLLQGLSDTLAGLMLQPGVFEAMKGNIDPKVLPFNFTGHMYDKLYRNNEPEPRRFSMSLFGHTFSMNRAVAS